MKRTYIFYSVLVVTALTINPLFAAEIDTRITQTKKSNSLSFLMAKNLYNRGLDSDVSIKISDEFFVNTSKNFAIMLNNLINKCDVVNEDDVMEYLSSLALRKKNIQLDSYTSLLSLVQGSTNKVLDKKTLNELELIASMNFMYSQSFT